MKADLIRRTVTGSGAIRMPRNRPLDWPGKRERPCAARRTWPRSGYEIVAGVTAIVCSSTRYCTLILMTCELLNVCVTELCANTMIVYVPGASVVGRYHPDAVNFES